MNDFVNRIPTKGKIMVQNNLAVRFTHKDLYLLISQDHLVDVSPDVVVLDYRPGQNINNYWPMTEEKMKSLAEFLKSNTDYKTTFQEDHRYIFTKKDYYTKFLQ